MAPSAEQRLGSPSSLIALTVGALGTSIEVFSFIAFLRRGDPADTTLVVADGVFAFFALLGAGLMIKNPRWGSITLACAGVASFISDMLGLSTPPRMIPGALMILSALITAGTEKEEATRLEALTEQEELKEPEAPPSEQEEIKESEGSAEQEEPKEPGAPPAEKEDLEVPEPGAPAERPNWMPVMVNLALGLHVVGAGFIGLGAGLVAPPVGVFTGWVIWAALLYGGIQLRRTKPLFALATPVLGVGAWFLLLTAGGILFGWTA